jgi:hypothetical protein
MTDFDVKRLAAQLDAAQRILDEIRITSGCEAFGPPLPPTKERVQVALEAAQRAVRDRGARSDFVGSKDIFGEPAWDILLDLFIRQTNEKQVSARAAMMHAGAGPSTVVRWLSVLEQNDLIETSPDPSDSKQRLIRLTPGGYEGMLRYLETIAR